MNYFELKRFYILLPLLILPLLSGKAQNKTFIICETDIPYQQQTWFYSGLGNKLDEANIKQYWDKGFRITSAAYTSKGWFVTMAQNTGLTEQTYKLSSSWPEKWFKAKWQEGYQITSMGRSDSQWLFVMSKGSGITIQSVWMAEWSKLSAWISKMMKEYYFITAMAYNGNNWTIVLSKDSEYSTQGYFFTDTQNELDRKTKDIVWNRGYKLHKIGYGNGKYFVVYGNYKDKNNRRQNYIVNPNNAKQYISAKWKDNLHIAYIGGGYSNNFLHSNSNVATANKHKSTRQRLPVPSGLDDFHLKEYKEKGFTRIELWRNSSERCVRDVAKCRCNGITQKCPICQGVGVDAYSFTCINCVGKGWIICAWCQGVGYTDHIFVNSLLDGTLLSADGKQVQNSNNYSHGSPTPSVDNRTKTCSSCYGSGYVPLSLGGIQTYENSTSCNLSTWGDHVCKLEQCSICKKTHCIRLHHRECSRCKGTGREKVY